MEKRGLPVARTFVVRVLHDRRGGYEAARWRAIVVDVRSGERRAITSYDELAVFIEERRHPEVTRD
jgi:hypothetical protein